MTRFETMRRALSFSWALCVGWSVSAANAQSCADLDAMQADTPPLSVARILDGLSTGQAVAVRQIDAMFAELSDRVRAATVANLAQTTAAARQFDLLVADRFDAAELPPVVINGWARFRLTQSLALNRLDCGRFAVKLLEEAASWPNLEQAVRFAVEGSLIGALQVSGETAKLLARGETLRGRLVEPASLDGLRGQMALLTNLGVAYRQMSGRNALALQTYLQALTLANSSNAQSLVAAAPGPEQRTFRGELARLEMNIASLYLFDQDVAKAQAHLDTSRGLIAAAGLETSRPMVDWFRILSDLERERGSKDAARDALLSALAVAQQIASPDGSLVADLRRRLAVLEGDANQLIQGLLAREEALVEGAGSTALERSLNARDLQQAYIDIGGSAAAVAWGEVALERMAMVSRAATVERGIVETKLSQSLANLNRLGDAFSMSKTALATLGEVVQRDASGCSIGQERNPGLRNTIREWHGLLSSALLQGALEMRDVALQNDIANQILSLIQAQEVDRIGAAALIAVLRERSPNAQSIEIYDQLIIEKCGLEDELARLGAVGSAESAEWIRVNAAIDTTNRRLESHFVTMDPTARSFLSGGRLSLDINGMKAILRDGEAFLGFRFGDAFSVGSLAIRADGDLTVVTIPLPGANRATIAQQVDRMLLAIANGQEDTEAAAALSKMLRLEQLRPHLGASQHLFVASDAALRRLPSHLLPVGQARLGDMLPSSSLTSTWTFALQRQLDDGVRPAPRPRGVMGVGDPALHFVNCQILPEFALPDDAPHRDVRCLGMPGGLGSLMEEAHQILGGPMPLVQQAATRSRLANIGLDEAGVLLFGTHGVVPASGEIPGLDEPALVLTPDVSDPLEDGLVKASEIASMTWDKAWLAILAACRTGDPSENEIADGLTGLALGFASAGVETVLVTQWAVPADETVVVIKTLLREMSDNPELTLAAALEAGMQEARAGSSNLQAWAAFNILGDGNVTLPSP